MIINARIESTTHQLPWTRASQSVDRIVCYWFFWEYLWSLWYLPWRSSSFNECTSLTLNQVLWSSSSPCSSRQHRYTKLLKPTAISQPAQDDWSLYISMFSLIALQENYRKRSSPLVFCAIAKSITSTPSFVRWLIISWMIIALYNDVYASCRSHHWEGSKWSRMIRRGMRGCQGLSISDVCEWRDDMCLPR